MSLASENNPYWMVYQTLWKMLRDSTDFNEMVRAPNQIDYFDEQKHFPDVKDTFSSADVPAVKIVPGRMLPQLDASSCSMLVSVAWQIQVATGTQPAKVELDLAWVILRAMSKWDTRLSALTWTPPGGETAKAFQVACRVRAVDETLEDRRAQRGILGWTSVWTGEVQLFFATADLQA